ncbi:MAG TPA: DUF692 domain-containing protein [Steroidobacteraceae bacterium]|nr:DUF692 domain-containing protein [Steroidobacteraceae bacterium]
MQPALGFGLGLRPVHYTAILESAPAVDWFEVITENYLVGGGRPLYFLDAIRARYPIVMHGVSLSIGSTAALDEDYLRRVRDLAARCAPEWISDHLCWTGTDGRNLHDLLPLPYTPEAVAHVAPRIEHVQERLGRPLVLENVSSYVSYTSSAMSEWEFLAALARRTGCRLLLDVNNVYVSSRNHGFEATEFIDGVPLEAVQQLHLAGHQDHGTHCIDTHDAPVRDEVWDLYAHTVRRFGPVSTLLERDDQIPPLTELVAELEHARAVARDARAEAA